MKTLLPAALVNSFQHVLFAVCRCHYCKNTGLQKRQKKLIRLPGTVPEVNTNVECWHVTFFKPAAF